MRSNHRGNHARAVCPSSSSRASQTVLPPSNWSWQRTIAPSPSISSAIFAASAQLICAFGFASMSLRADVYWHLGRTELTTPESLRAKLGPSRAELRSEACLQRDQGVFGRWPIARKGTARTRVENSVDGTVLVPPLPEESFVRRLENSIVRSPSGFCWNFALP